MNNSHHNSESLIWVWIGIMVVAFGAAILTGKFSQRGAKSRSIMPGRRDRLGGLFTGQVYPSNGEHASAAHVVAPIESDRGDLTTGMTPPDATTIAPVLVGSAREIRIKGDFRAKMRQPGGRAITVRVWDLSAGGFSAEWPHKLQCGDRVWLTVPGTESQTAFVAWTQDFIVGCEFETRLHDAILNSVVRRAKGLL